MAKIKFTTDRTLKSVIQPHIYNATRFSRIAIAYITTLYLQRNHKKYPKIQNWAIYSIHYNPIFTTQHIFSIRYSIHYNNIFTTQKIYWKKGIFLKFRVNIIFTTQKLKIIESTIITMLYLQRNNMKKWNANINSFALREGWSMQCFLFLFDGILK